MAESKEEENVVVPENVRNLVTIGDKLNEILTSEEYNKVFYGEIDELKKLLAEDDKRIQETGKSAYTRKQRIYMQTQICAMGSVDSAVGNLMNILTLRYGEEIETLAARDALAKIEAEEGKKDE